jgi:hypothetical protein
MKTITIALIGAASFALTACDVDQTKEAKLPDVDVNVTEGQLPEYNVTTPTVEVGTENKTVEVPTVDVNIPAENAQ